MPRFGLKRAKPSVITLADRACDLEQWELAAGYYRDALHRKPKNQSIWLQYGHVLKMQGKKKEAWEAYLRAFALELSPATEAALRTELRAELEQRAASEAQLRSEIEQRAANEAQLRLEIEQGAEAEAVLRAALTQAEQGVQERAAARDTLQAEFDLMRGALAIDDQSPETTSIVSPADWGLVQAQPIIEIRSGETEGLILHFLKAEDYFKGNVAAPVASDTAEYDRITHRSAGTVLLEPGQYVVIVRDSEGELLAQSGIIVHDPSNDDRDLARFTKDRPFLVEHSKQMLYKPLFLILIEADTGGPISETFISLENQIYPHWRAYLIHSCAWSDPTNLPEGEFLIPIRGGDILSPEALYEFANALNACPDWDMIYADEDRVLANDRFGEPFYKPDWSPDYLETFNYIGYPACFRRNVAEGCSLGDGYYGFVLRLTEKTKQISHIRKVLCHRSYKSLRRTVVEETLEAHALAARLQRTGRNGEVLPIGNGAFGWRLRVALRSFPLVSILIPTAGKIVSHEGRDLDLIINCVSQIHKRSTYRNFEIILVDNDDISPLRKEYLNQLNCKFVTYRDSVFNIAKKLNLGALEAAGDFLLLLNDDIEIMTPEWIEEMLGHFEKDHVGVVGVKLLYPDGRIQHAGVVHNFGNPDHVRRGFDRSDRGYFLSTCGVRNFSAVTGACMMVRTEVYRSVSGYTEELAVNYNDVDFCQKVRAAGLTVVYTPHVELIHFESQSHEVWLDPNDWNYYVEQWAPELTFDPFYNERNLSLAPPTFDPVVNNKRLV